MLLRHLVWGGHRVAVIGHLDAAADLECGLEGFVIERDGVGATGGPSKPVETIGRSIFQLN